MRSVGCVPAVCLLFLFFSHSAPAQERYVTQVRTGYRHTALGSESRLNVVDVTATQYLEPVWTKGHPYAEAAFLERVGSISTTARGEELSASGSSLRGWAYLLAAEVVLRESPIVLSVVYAGGRRDSAGIIAGGEQRTRGVSAGWFPARGLLAEVVYSESKTDFAFSSATNETFGLTAKYVDELERETAVGLSAGLFRSTIESGFNSPANTIATLSVDYYLDRSMSVGAGITDDSGENAGTEGRTYRANVRMFVTPRVWYLFRHDRFRPTDARVADQKSYGIDVGARF